jgi:hypothetical protein
VTSASDEDAYSLLFLSCDIVGSTGYKQKSTLWRKTFLTFYRDFPQALGKLTREADYEPGFVLWKAVGDELIFTSRVRTERHVSDAFRIWLAAMDVYERQISEEGLGTKGGAFIATFPGPDSESSIPLDPTTEVSDKGVFELNRDALAAQDKDRYLFDYFGPSIDTGFRVVSQCNPRYFTLSVEVVWALARARSDDSDVPFNDILLHGSPELKGVWKGRQYPLFAVDRHLADPINSAMNEMSPTALTHGVVADLCAKCHADPSWPSRLYLPDSGLQRLREKPEDSLQELADNEMVGAESLPTEPAPAGGALANPPLD